MDRNHRRAVQKLKGKTIQPGRDARTAIDSVDDMLAVALKYHQADRLDEAERLYRKILLVDRSHSHSLHLLGVIAYERDQHTTAFELINRAIELNNGVAEFYNNLGTVLKAQGKLIEAGASFEHAITLKPAYALAHNNLGTTLRDQGKPAEAVACFERTLALKSDYPEAYNNLGNALWDLDKLTESVASYERALSLKPDYAEAYNNLGSVLQDQGKLTEAIASYERALDLKPDHVDACSNLNFCLNYNDAITASQLFTAHRDWNKRFGRPDLKPVPYANDCSAGRRLRVGYVSPDFRSHSVAYFIEPLLREHDRHLVEIYCYADVLRPDAVTERLRGYADYWVETIGLSNDSLAERVRTDSIDILVDLAGHTGRNRLAVFARKPAPIQVTWLGYPNTTGLDAIDYRLVDSTTDPSKADDACASEILVRLEGGFLCYVGPNDAPMPTLPPCLTSGHVTFGSFNNPTKLSPATLVTWARLLKHLPQSHLLLKGHPFADAATRAYFLSRLGAHGVATERVELVGWVPSGTAHLALYDRVDIALDPFPYNGTTTTCEALWMGVPVVTLRGDRHAGRVGASLLSQVGLLELIADSMDDYLELAVKLAGHPSRLTRFRQSLRPRVAASPLCDAPAFARKIEGAYRAMWLRWCEAG